MSLITEFQHALLNALKNYKAFHSQNNIPIPPDRENDFLKLKNFLKEENNVLILRKKYIEQYQALSVPGIVKVFPFLDKCLLRKNLKEVLFNKKFSEKALEKAYLYELINTSSVQSKARQELLKKIEKLEADLSSMRQQHQKLCSTYNQLLDVANNMNDQNVRLKEVLKNNNIPLDEITAEEYNLEEFKYININSCNNDLEENCNVSGKIPAEKFEITSSCTNFHSEPNIPVDQVILPSDLPTAHRQIIDMKAQIKTLAQSKEQMLNANLKKLQKDIEELEEPESSSQQLQPTYSFNNNNATKAIPIPAKEFQKEQKEETQNSSMPPYFYRTFTR